MIWEIDRINCNPRSTATLTRLLVAKWGSQDAVANKLGVSQVAISRWLRGAEPRRWRDLEQLRHWARRSGIAVSDHPSDQPYAGWIDGNGVVHWIERIEPEKEERGRLTNEPANH